MKSDEKVTVWEKLNPSTGRFDHNHYVEGWVDAQEADVPVPTSDIQRKAWAGATWRMRFAWKKYCLVADCTTACIVAANGTQQPVFECPKHPTTKEA